MFPFSLAEVTIFNLIRAVPLLLLAFYPFRGKRRFSPEITALIYEAILLVWMVTSLANAYFLDSERTMLASEACGFILIAVLYVFANRAQTGRMLFFCFLLINVGYMTTVTSKCLESFLFPELAVEKYRWSASLCICIMSALILIPVHFFMRWEGKYAPREMQPAYIWKYSWLVPLTFYLIWGYEFYGSGDSLAWSMNIKNVLFMVFVNICSFIIYSLIIRLVMDNASSLQLREENHKLAMQVVQYNELNSRINTARQARHDVRHHIVTLENMAQKGNLEGVRSYLSEITDQYQLDDAMIYCSNETVNGILFYFYKEAEQNGIEFKVNLGIPEEINVARTDLSVLFGNLLENAIEACSRMRGGKRSVQVRGQTNRNTLAFTIDNTFEVSPRRDRKGRFRSMKHEGMGIGTESAKNIVARYNGVIEFETRGTLFCVSVMLYLPG